jgi:aryl-alcohol dehydrogenase
MKAALVETAGGPFVIDDVELDDPRPDEIVVRMVAVGLCHTDLAMRDRLYPVRLPHVFGHEGAGVVVAAGRDVSSPAVGDGERQDHRCVPAAEQRSISKSGQWWRRVARGADQNGRPARLDGFDQERS